MPAGSERAAGSQHCCGAGTMRENKNIGSVHLWSCSGLGFSQVFIMMEQLRISMLCPSTRRWHLPFLQLLLSDTNYPLLVGSSAKLPCPGRQLHLPHTKLRALPINKRVRPRAGERWSIFLLPRPASRTCPANRTAQPGSNPFLLLITGVHLLLFYLFPFTVVGGGFKAFSHLGRQVPSYPWPSPALVHPVPTPSHPARPGGWLWY